MRKINAVLTVLILILFLLHGVAGAFQLFGAGSNTLKILGWISLGLVAVHTVIGIKLTADTLKVQKQTGAPYFRENLLFWARRISGFALIFLFGFHITAFGSNASGVYRLLPFGTFKLVMQLLLAASLAVHVISNVRPMLISFGIRSLKERSGDILFVLALLLLFMTLSFIVYYIRWNSF